MLKASSGEYVSVKYVKLWQEYRHGSEDSLTRQSIFFRLVSHIARRWGGGNTETPRSYTKTSSSSSSLIYKSLHNVSADECRGWRTILDDPFNNFAVFYKLRQHVYWQRLNANPKKIHLLMFGVAPHHGQSCQLDTTVISHQIVLA